MATANEATARESGSIETRLEHLESVEQIHALFMEYGKCLDRKDWDGFSRLYAENGEFVSSAGVGVATGPDEIREMMGRVLKDVPASAFHLFNNIAINVTGDRATATSFWTYLRAKEDGWPQILQFGHYDDVLVRSDGRWLFQRRVITRDMGFLPYTK